MKWIDVKDDLPKTVGDVLVYEPGEEPCIAFVPLGFSKLKLWELVTGGSTNRVTHWMPLPAPPLPEIREAKCCYNCIYNNTPNQSYCDEHEQIVAHTEYCSLWVANK